MGQHENSFSQCVPVSETFDQANMIQEVLEDVRNIVRDQIAEALLNFTLPQYPPIYDHPSQNQGRADKMIHLPHQQANVISGMPHAFENAIGQQ